MPEVPARTSGRPRSETTRAAILSAAYTLLTESGFDAASIEAVARQAGAGKSTVYRWWPSKAALLLDAVHEQDVRYPPLVSSGDFFADLTTQIRGVIAFYRGETGGAMLDLIARGRCDPELRAAINARFIADRRSAARSFFAAGVAAGVIRSDIDTDTVTDLIWGSVYYRLLILGQVPELDYADTVVAAIRPALQRKP